MFWKLVKAVWGLEPNTTVQPGYALIDSDRKHLTSVSLLLTGNSLLSNLRCVCVSVCSHCMSAFAFKVLLMSSIAS